MKRDAFEIDIALGCETRVGRDEVVLASNLQAVAGIEEQCHFSARQLLVELADQALHRALVEVHPIKHHEPQPLQSGCNIGRIVQRILELGGLLIGGIADHQSDAVAGSASGCTQGEPLQQTKETQDGGSYPRGHDFFPPLAFPHLTDLRGLGRSRYYPAEAAIAARISVFASSLSHSAGPTKRPISRPLASSSNVAGMPMALSPEWIRTVGSA